MGEIVPYKPRTATRMFAESTLSKMPVFHRWKHMRDRCKYATKNWLIYQRKGITVCDEWQKFKPFYYWAIENGFKPDLQLDRIDNKEGYSPDNCRWVTPKQNSRNRDSNVFWEYEGHRRTVAEWSEITGIRHDTLIYRKNHNWPIEKVLKTPVDMTRYSLKRQKKNKEYAKLRIAYLEANPQCQAKISEDCQARSGEIHHKRGRVGNNLIDVSNFVAVCRDCHNKLERNPRWAKSLGLSESRLK